jgi:glycosyltransferase involved in cell wall biosynthesis
MKILSNDFMRNPLWWFHSYKKALELYKRSFKFDVVHCHDLDTLVAGVLLKKKLGIKLVFDAHEIFGYMVMRTMPKFVADFAFILEKYLLRFVDSIITAEETYNDYFRSICYNPIITILNCKDIIEDKYQKSENDVFTVIYIGVLNKSRFFPEALDVIGNIKNIKFVIAGKKENMYNLIEELSKKYNNIEFLGSISYDKVVPYTLKSDVILCMINPNDYNNKIASANKQFEAMVCGRPIICTKGTRSGDITEKEKCGLIIEYSKDSLRKGIIKLRDNKDLCKKLGRNALNAALNKYNWGIEKSKLLKLYKNME